MNTKVMLIIIASLIIFSSIAYAEACEVSRIKQALVASLNAYFTKTNSSDLNLQEVKDLLVFYLSVNGNTSYADCSRLGSLSNKQILSIIESSENSNKLSKSKKNQTDNKTCADSDNGKAPNIKGSAVGELFGVPGQYDDFCILSDLTEYNCDNDHVEVEEVECDYGCKDGACVKQQNIIVSAVGTEALGKWSHMHVRVNGQIIGDLDVTATWEDGWTEYPFYYDGEVNSLDIVFTNDAWNMWLYDRNLYVNYFVINGVRVDTNHNRVVYDLGSGEQAFDGKSVRPGTAWMYWGGALRYTPNNITCTDSDGDTIYVAGRTVGENGWFGDSCNDASTVKEHLCDADGQVYSVLKRCEYGCYAGKCDRKPGDFIIHAKGTGYCGTWPIVMVRINDKNFQELNVETADWKNYSYYYSEPINSVDLVFTNKDDEYNNSLFIDYLIINSSMILSSGPSVKYDLGYGYDALDGAQVIPGQSEMKWNGALRFNIT